MRFQNEKRFIGHRLFADHFFNHFERLAIGYYGEVGNYIDEFGSLRSADDVAFAVDSWRSPIKHNSLRRLVIISKTEDSTLLSRSLDDILQRQGDFAPSTVVIFVSKNDASIVREAQPSADALKKRGTRLVLVGLGGLNLQPLRPLVSQDRDLNSAWDARSQQTPPNYRNWFRSLVCRSGLCSWSTSNRRVLLQRQTTKLKSECLDPSSPPSLPTPPTRRQMSLPVNILAPATSQSPMICRLVQL